MTDTLEETNLTECFPFTFWVGGKPRPKGSLSGRCLRDRNHTVVMREQVDNKAWRRAVAQAAKAQLPPCWVPYADAMIVTVSVFFERERGVSGEIMPSYGTAYPVAPVFGDEDKHSRMVKDALKDAGMIKDDRFVVRCLVNQEFAGPDCPAGAQITVEMR